MKLKRMCLVFAVLLALNMLTGCVKGASGNTDSDRLPNAQPVVMERVPVLDKQYKDILSDFDYVGAFHHGAAFAATILPPSESGIPYTNLGMALECGYVTLDGTYTPLYILPNEYELESPEGDKGNRAGRRMNFGCRGTTKYELMLIQAMHEAELSKENLEEISNCKEGPFVDDQAALDQIFAVGDNGWVPYFENDKWGYCDLEGNIKIAPVYDFVQPFYDGTALVCTYNENYQWYAIDATGAQTAAFDPTSRFATRLPNSHFFVMHDSLGHGTLHSLDGSMVSEELTSVYADDGAGVIALGSAIFYDEENDKLSTQDAAAVYDADGQLLYNIDTQGAPLPLLDVQDGCTVFSQDNLLGICGSDGNVCCEARFMDILELAPEGFYAREQGRTSIGLYDYDGTLIEDAPPCAWICDNTNGYIVYDGRGNVLAEYPAGSVYDMNGKRFFTEEGFAYLYLDLTEFVTLHFTFEERPAEEAQPVEDTPVSTVPNAGLAVTQTGSVDAFDIGDWDFSITGFDDMPVFDRSLLSSKEGLDWYYSAQGELFVCDKDLNTIFQVPNEPVRKMTDRYDNGEPNYPRVRLYYLGDGLWTISLNQIFDDRRTPSATFIFDRDGNILLSEILEHQEMNTYPECVSEGYFYFPAQQPEHQGYISAETGELLTIHTPENTVPSSDTTDESNLLNIHGHAYFSKGLAPSPYGYIDTQGNVVLSNAMLQQALEAYPEAEGKTVSTISSFIDDTAFLIAYAPNPDLSYRSYFFTYSIDRDGNITGQYDSDHYEALLKQRREALTEETEALHTPFRIMQQRMGMSVLLHNSKEVFAPQGWKLTGNIIQINDLYVFVQLRPEDNFYEHTYMLLDAQGNFYPEYAWDAILPTPGDSVNVYNFTEDNIDHISHIEITPVQ